MMEKARTRGGIRRLDMGEWEVRLTILRTYENPKRAPDRQGQIQGMFLFPVHASLGQKLAKSREVKAKNTYQNNDAGSKTPPSIAGYNLNSGATLLPLASACALAFW